MLTNAMKFYALMALLALYGAQKSVKSRRVKLNWANFYEDT